jgi:hypothetical protein
MLMAGCSEGPVGTKDSSLAGGPSAEELDDAMSAGGGIPFSKLAIFFEFNFTDNDLGVQVFLDAEDWKWIKAFDEDGAKVLDIGARNQLRELGVTELRFESAEPSPEEVLALFPDGEYRFEGKTTEGMRLVGTAVLSQALPPAPVFTPNAGDVTDPDNTVIAWAPIPGLAGYEVIVANEDTDASLEVRLDASATSFHVPPEFLGPSGKYKAEVLSIAMNGNKTIAEALFFTMP